MAKTLQQILGGRNLTGVINEVAGGVPDDLLPAAFMTPTRTIEGDTGTYFKVNNTRKTARRAKYGAAPSERDKVATTETPFMLNHSIEEMRHTPHTLINLMSTDGARQRLGEQEVARQVGEMARLFTNLRMGMIYSGLANGAIYFNIDGELLPSSSGAEVTVDFVVPAGHKTQLDFDGNGDMISASWATAGTKIITDVGNIRKASRKETGLPLVHAMYGINLPDYFLTNTQTKELMNRDATLRASMAGGTIPNGFLGFQWWPVAEAFFTDAAGTNQDFFGDDTLILTPEVSTEWWDFPEGTYPIPTDIGNVAADASGALGNFTTVAGMFSYAYVDAQNPAVVQVAGDTVLPIIRNPKALWIADVTP